jgi:hypothetical protein
MSELKAVKFQHRIATGHSTLKKAFEVTTKDPVSGEQVKQSFRHHTPVPTKLVVDDALVLVAPPTQDGSAPRVSLLYLNGNSMMGADWQNCVSVEHDVPHVGAKGAKESERYWFSEADASAVKGEGTKSSDGVIAALEAAAESDDSAPAGGQTSQTGSDNQGSD